MEDKIQLQTQPPVGYNPIAQIRGAYFHWLLVPFFADRGGEKIWCKCHCLNASQLKACGNLVSLMLPEDKKEKSTKEDGIRFYNAMENVCIATLIEPTFSEIIKMLTDEDFRIEEKKKMLAEFEELINNEKLKTKGKKELQDKIDLLNQEIGFLLPDDTMGFLTAWALGVDVTDINKITKKILLDAAILARAGKTSPHKYISGVFTDKHKEEIDMKAWVVLSEFDEDKKHENELKKKGFTVRGNRPAKNPGKK